MSQPIHIERSFQGGHAVMVCGAWCLFDERGDTTPTGFDFVLPHNADLATCDPCRTPPASDGAGEKRRTLVRAR